MSGYTVLLVEDSEFITKHVSETLGDEHGFDVRAVNTAAETRSAIDDGGIDCVITSYELPDETGLELAESVNGTDGTVRVPFVLFTGNPLEPLAEDGLEVGVSAFVSKSNRATGDMNIFANRIRLAIEAHDSQRGD